MGRRTLLCLALTLLAAVSCAAKDFSYSPYAGEPDAWFAGPEGRRIANTLVYYQLPHGGWSKGIDMTAGLPDPDQPKSVYSKGEGTFDNNATTSQMRFLARAYRATGDPRYRKAFLDAVDYVLQAQHPSGGWPQVYPLAGGYHDCATYNDNAMIHVMELINDIMRGPGFEWVDAARRRRLGPAFERGLGYILKSQIEVNGRLTAWCQQHDPVTYEPRPARTYEHASLVSSESAGILAFLIGLRHKTPAIGRAIEAGTAWLREVAIEGYRRDTVDGNQSLVPDPEARVWARFYEIGTNRPIFSDRDGVIKYSIEEIGSERRNGYSWYTSGPEKVFRLLEEENE